MTVVVTGASGHLGANLVRLLLETGQSVRAIVRRNTSALEDLDLELVHADILDRRAMTKALHGAQCVHHLAGKIAIVPDRDGSVFATNVEGTTNVAECALEAGVERFVYASSIHAFDYSSHPDPDAPLDESFSRLTLNADAQDYDRSKAEAGRRVLSLVKQGLPAVVVHPTGIIGPHDFGPSRMGQVFLDLKARKLPSLIDGSFDFVDARDVSAGMLAAAQAGRIGESYILGGATASIKELADLAASVTGVQPPRFTCPMGLAQLAAPFAEAFAELTGKEPLFTRGSLDTLSRGRVISSDKAKRDLGYSPRSLYDSIRDVYADFKQRGL